MNYWLHRISHLAELSYPLLERGFLSIGFSDLTNADVINDVNNNDWKSFNDKIVEKWGVLPRSRHSLWNFLSMEKGDIVIVPSSGTFWVCQITGDNPILPGEAFSDDLRSWGDKTVGTRDNLLTKEDGNVYDLGFAWKVEVLFRDISRGKFADAKLTSRMKMRQTNAQINDLKQSIENSIQNFKDNRPIHLHSIIVEKTSRLVLKSIVDELNPDKFEKLITLFFKTIGASDVFIPAKNENGKEGDADIIAVFESLKLIIYTQAKFQNGEISEWGANQILEYKTNKESIDDGYNKIAWVITTADKFSESAENLAKENEIQLISGEEFSTMLLNAGINLLNTDL